MRKDIKGFLGHRWLLVWLLSMVSYVILKIAGTCFAHCFPNGKTLWAGVILTWFFLSGCSVLLWLRFKKKFSLMSLRDALVYGKDLQDRKLQDPSVQRRKLRCIAFLCKSFWLILFLLSISACFFAGTREDSSFDFLSFLFLSGHISRFLRPKDRMPLDMALPRDQFPLLYAVAEEAAGPLKKPIYIFPGPVQDLAAYTASISKDQDGYHLILGMILTGVSSREELLQVLRQEFSHVRHSHLQESENTERLLIFLTNEDNPSFFSLFTDLALRFPSIYLAMQSEFYLDLISKVQKAEADASAAKDATASVTAGALAKAGYYRFFWLEECPKMNFFRDEYLSLHHSRDLIELFRERVSQRGAVWQDLLMKEIPAQVDSPPTFRQRWEALGKPQYEVSFPSQEDAYGLECFAYVNLSDRLFRDFSGGYNEERQKNYLEPLRVVETLSPQADQLTPHELHTLINAYNQLGMIEEGEALCDRILETATKFSGAFARYWKGIYLIYRHDPEGISHIYQAMDANPNFIKIGLKVIGSACPRLGLAEELEEYHRRYEPLMQLYTDHTAVGNLRKAKLSPETLPEGMLEEILERILSTGNGHIQKVYLVHEKHRKSFDTSSFVLQYTEDTTEDEQESIYDEIYSYLDDHPTGWEFALYDYEISMKKPLSKIPGSCVYDSLSIKK